MTGQAIVLRGNALQLPLPDESVDLIVTSPPYFALRSYQDEGEHYDGQIGSESTPKDFLDALVAATAEMKRVLKPSGSIWLNLGDKYAGSGGHNNSNLEPPRRANAKDDSTRTARRIATRRNICTCSNGTTDKFCPVHWKEGPLATRRNAPDRYNQNTTTPTKSLELLPHRYAIRCVDELGLICRQDQVWSKPNGLPESVTDRTRRSHEYWFHLVKSPRYFSAVDEIREPHITHRIDGLPTRHDNGALFQGQRSNQPGNPLGKLPGSVWTIPTEPLKVPAHLGIDHFAAFPTEWPRRLILGWSPSGICVECGEGRRPVVERGEEVGSNDQPLLGGDATSTYGIRPKERRIRTATGYVFPKRETTIIGYACACPEPTAGTTPAIVVDVFGGTGTTALVAKTLGRIGISLDLSHDYSRLAQWRTSKHSIKAMSRTNLERQGNLL